jgi:hypothetical protein
MPQGGRGKARKISNDMIIDSDDDSDVAVATKELPVPNLMDAELSDSSLPATVSIDKPEVQGSDAPALHGIKRKISALVPRKHIPAATGSERKQLFLFFDIRANKSHSNCRRQL